VDSPSLRSSEESRTDQAMLDKLRIDRTDSDENHPSYCESCRCLWVRILRQIAHLRSHTLLFALTDVPEDRRSLNQRTSANDS
jgi:hypothetical protein